ncbi:MAG: hypothetical protein L3J41_15790 [Melioribacteraceae bacterium]|nr:hypothetical protein [Melioribacteraceae bacterium]
MKIPKDKISSPVGMIVNFVGILVFIAGVFTSVYYFSISNYIFTIWAFLGGLLFFAICSGISELIFQLLELRSTLSLNKKKKRKDYDI